MALVYRTSGAWGSGQGSNLSPAQVDSNFYYIAQQLTQLADEINTNVVSIASITVTGSVMTITMTSGTVYTFNLPVAMIRFRGNWLPSTTYTVNDVITAPDGNLYGVIFNHVSSSTSFDPNANDGAGHNYYQLLLPGVVAQWPAVDLLSLPLYTLQLQDAGTYIRCNAPHGTTIIVPAAASVNFAINTEIHFRQVDPFPIMLEIQSGSSVTLNIPSGFLPQTDRIGATLTIKKVGADIWDVFGLLAVIGSP